MSTVNTNPIFTGAFWKATAERVITTFIQAYLGTWLAGDLVFDVFEFDWVNGLGIALGAAVLSLIKCVIAGNIGNAGPSLANETLTDYPKVGRID